MLESFEAAAGRRQVLTWPGDNRIRWAEGERLHHLFERSAARFADAPAVVTDTMELSYRELDARANRVARHLIACGVRPGDRVALLFDRTVETYVALLAVLKVHAAYVPLDAGFPVERLRFILSDAGVKTVVSMSTMSERLDSLEAERILLDAAADEIAARSCTPLGADEVAPPADQTCYILYTSGTTGNPKGVVVEHPSICNFVRVAAEMYGYAPGDRVYQGMTIAFDFSVEETWVPLMAGATLVPGRSGMTLVGEELAEFLHERRVSVMACCPTLLATIERELPQLRILLVGGEACPKNLVTRWHRAGRTILNSYGPTEATVTATLTELTPDRPVTIGVPLPTYAIVILESASDRLAADGELGEIGIAGIGVAAGYLNRDELTAKKFIRDFLELPGNPSGRIYRTGDLGRINDEGEIEYHGRIDTQVKIRGYRIETIEIEQVLLELPQIAQAAVTIFEPEPGLPELVAYYALKQGAALARNEIAQALRRRLPAYMVPAYLEELDAIPMSASNKADHKRLPKPTGPRCPTGGAVVAPKTETERLLVRVLAEVLRTEGVSTEAHVFDDLGANSLLMARFCARVRQHPRHASLSMRDIYTHPTIASLAAHLDAAGEQEIATTVAEPFHVPSDLSYWTCGSAQLAFFAAYALFGLWIFDAGLDWTYAAAADPLALYLRGVVFAAASFLALAGLPVAAKWLLVGRWTEERIPLWSLRYFRFWMIKTLLRTSPMIAFIGSPLYSAYLRLLGARIGRNTVVASRFVPVCTDLIAIGDDTVLRKDSILLGYRAQSNFIHTGRVEIGRNAFVGEASVLDIDTRMGDDTQLGHGSSLQSGQRIPDGRRWHGSPAVETSSDYCPIEARPCTTLRRAVYSALQLAGLFGIAVPLPIVGLVAWEHAAAQATGSTASAFDATLTTMLAISATAFLGSLLAALAAVYAVPRLANLFLRPGRTYVLFGVHHWLQSVVSQVSNARFFNVLFGDSSFIVHYTRFVGWNLNRVEQTGSNLGTNQKHDNPFLCDIGSATMVSDGLSMINMDMSSSSFRLATTRIGDDNYLGNNIHYPPGGRTGANVLLATKVMIPVDGPVRENVGLLGSPPFEIPRMVDRDREMNAAIGPEQRRARLRAKNLHNLVTASLFLLSRWMFFFATLVAWQVALLHHSRYGVFALFGAMAALAVGMVLYFVLLERASTGFRRLTPRIASIYDPYFWSHERHWKLSDTPIMQLFAGTPFKSLILRMVGVRIGRKVYDAGCAITERTLTEIGDYANLNEGSVLQAHSLEEGVLKSDHIRLGKGCTLGPAAFVHYGVTMGDHVVIDADSFLMKGETLDSHTGWRGNPARLVRGAPREEFGPCITDDAAWDPALAVRIAAE
ncbi:MAG: amino acid adenylation domain-containing protein [Xanthobacteraceae bacterium]|nr:amino acid adenylation domain-containing protein [Xanthobacteraceae bacterium]